MDLSPSPTSQAPSRTVVWHDLECGGYRADLALWRELAEREAPDHGHDRILDIGSGNGRVTIDLARRGHRMTALDLDPELLGALEQRATDLDVKTVCADARGFRLEERDHALCFVPMQTIQLLRGSAERQGLLESAREHLCPGSLIACAIVTDVDSFDALNGGLGPSPEHARIDGRLYVSRAIRVEVDERFIRIERERFVADEHRTPRDEPSGAPEQNVIELERLTAEQLGREGQEVGLRLEPTVTISETADHAGSEVVMLRV
jgi:SAM-dependent methyltransferase